MGKATKEAVIENRGAVGPDPAPAVESNLSAADRIAFMGQAIIAMANAFDVTAPKILSRDEATADARREYDENNPLPSVNLLGKYRRWSCNAVMRMFGQAIEQVKGDLKQQQRRTYALQHGRSRGQADEFAINQSLDWEDRYELILCELKALFDAANEAYGEAFEEMFDAPQIVEGEAKVVVPEGLSAETQARLAARRNRSATGRARVSTAS